MMISHGIRMTKVGIVGSKNETFYLSTMQNPPKRNLIVLAGIIMCVVIVSKGLLETKDLNAVTNYYSYESDALPSAEDPSFAPKPKSIFFHVTSFHGKLTAHQACSVESAARAHPHWQIYVLFSAPVTDHALKITCLAKLLQFHNVKFLRVHIAEYSKGTPVQSILENDLKESKFPMQHSADILSILTLHKWGGIYLDTDMVVVKSLATLPSNWMVKKRKKFVETGIMAFAKDDVGGNVTYLILKEIFETYDPDNWTIRRPIQRVILRMCPTVITINDCNGVAMFHDKLFYPINNILWTIQYDVNEYNPNYSFRMWDIQNRSLKEPIPFEVLVRKYCPSIYLMHAEDLEF